MSELAEARSSSSQDTVRIAAGLVARGSFTAAAELLEAAIRIAPADAHLHWQLAACYASGNELHLAHGHYREAARLDPSLASAHAGLGALYLVHGIVDRAIESSTAAMALAPANHQIALSHARILEAAGHVDAAWNLTRWLIDDKFITPGVVRLFGRMARYRDQQPVALAMVLNLLAHGNHPTQQRAALHFTAADLLDSLGRYDEAFAHAVAGNAMVRPRYDPVFHQRTFDRFIEYFTAETIARLARSAEPSDKPVFIVGMPRSGTSLIEQILASHSAIHGAGELDFMERVFLGTVSMLGSTGSDYPQNLDHLTTDQATGMGQIYLLPLIGLSPNSTRITDKLPLNFLHLGLIQLLLPGARIIHCRRDPTDTCLSCHMNSFAFGNDFKFDLTHLGLFHRQYQRLMAHWTDVLDLPILDIWYEDVVTDPDGQTRRLLSFLDVPYDSTCLKFHQTDRPVLTSSIEQVRQPLYADSVHRWKHYRKHLAPLRGALGI